MRLLSPRAARILEHPGAFAFQVLKAFRANQGLLLAGAVAYYTLLSIVPLLILTVMVLSNVVDQKEVLETLRRALDHIAQGQGEAIIKELAGFMEHRLVIGWVLVISMIFFSSLAFKVLENAISVIFLHRVAERKRHFLVSMLLPFGYIVVIGVAILIGSLVLVLLIGMGEERLVILGHSWSLGGVSRIMLYVAGVLVEIFIITSIYLFMPVGRLALRHALIGGVTAGLLWEVIRHILAWYFSTYAQVSAVYGSLTTTIVLLLTLEIAATLLLLGAQVIAEYERVGTGEADDPPTPMRTDRMPQPH
jgi:membrane protein